MFGCIFKSGLNIPDKTKGKSKVYYISTVGKDPSHPRISLRRIGLHLSITSACAYSKQIRGLISD
tara:strand:- start:4885 stop:5079 length:195 start_codon:yes stop_codon:yes gene_type:complete